MKKSITILTFLTMIGFVGILPGALPAAGPSDAFSAGVGKPIYLPVITEGESVSVTMDEDGSPTPFTLTLHATDADGDPLTWGINSGATYGNAAVATGTGTSQDITYAPAPNFSGSDSFVVRVIDGVDGGDTITVNVTVRPRNDAPVNTAVPTVTGTLHVGHMLTGTPGTWNDSTDTTPGTLTYAYQWQRADDASGGNTVDIAGATGTTHSIVNDDNQKYLRFRVTATDDGEGLPASASTTVSTEWQPVANNSPDITEGVMAHATLDEDSSPTAFALTLNVTDVDGDTLTWSILTAAIHGTATASGTGTSKAISYTPAQDYNTAAGGSESFVVQVDDGLGGTDTITVDVTVNPRNDGPVNTVPGAQATTEDTAVVFSSGAGNPISVADLDVADTPGGTLQLTLSVEHGTLILSTVAGLTFATGDGVSDPTMTFYGTPANLINALNGLAYTPAANYHGADTLTVATNDRGYTGAGGDLTDTDTVPITVTGVNDAPAVGGVAAAGVVDADNGETAYDFTVTFTDDSAIDVATLDNSDVYVRTPGATTIAATFVSVDTPGNGTPRTATYRIVPPGGSWDVADNGTYTIGIYGSQVGDDEAATVPASANIGTFTVALETTAPTVLDVTSGTANGSYRAGQSILIQVTVSEPVVVTGNPRLTMETGASDGIAAYMSGSGTSALTFLYTVLSPHVSADLDYAGTTALALNGGTIKDAVGNDAALTLPVPGAAGSLSANKDIVIDTTAPAAPNAPDLQASSDAGTSNTDNVTDVTTPSFDIAGVETGATVTLTSQVVGGGGPIVVQAVAGGSTCTITMTSPLSPGVYVITATQTDLAGNVSLASAAMAPNLYIAIAPSVTTQAATDVASAAATGHGTIVALGSPSPTAHGLVWNTSGMPTLADFSTNEGAVTSTGAFTSSLMGLSPNTLYYVRSYATNGLTTSYGDQLTFTSLQAFTLTYTAGAGGTITGTSPQTVDYGGSGATVTAVPNTNYHFVSWSDGVMTEARTDANVTADVNVTATFASDVSPERTALIALYTATGGDSWTVRTGWKDGDLYEDGFAMPGTESTWFGVVMTGAAITAISLPANNLVGSIPSELGDLSSLTVLDLRSNSLTGSIPARLGDLTNLTLLRLSYNQLTGTLPAELWNLVNLQTLDLCSNQLSGTLPAAIGNLTALRELLLYTNQFSGALPSEMGSLVNLRSLALHANGFSGALPASMGGLTALQELLLHENAFTGAFPDEWGGLSALTFLRIDHNELSGPIPATFGNLSNLTALIAGNNGLSGTIPPELANLHNLVTLDFRFNSLTGTIPAFLGGMTSLQVLYLQHNIGLIGSIPPELGNLTSLRELLLQGDALTGGIPVELGNLANLQMLYLNSNQLTGTIPSVLGNLHNLTNLHLQSNQLSGSIPPELGGLTNLTDLCFSDNSLEGEIPAELGNLTQLQILSAYGTKLTGPIPTSLTNLTALVPASTDIGYNMLYASDEALITFLNAKDPDWAATQTVAPTQVTATSLDNAVVLVSWLPIAYTAGIGYYGIWISETAGGPYTLAGQTTDKATSSVQVTGLTPGTRYYFIVRTHSDVHAANKNALDSGYSSEVSAFAWTQVSAQISGNIAAGGLPLAGVVMSGLPNGTVTDTSGNYSGTVSAGSNITVIPMMDGYTFSPASRSYPGITENQTGQDYAATEGTTHTLTYTAGANGTISGISPQTVAHGSSGTEVTAVPNTGYHFVSWSDGVLTAARTDSNVTSDITVTASFAVTSYTLTYTAGANGTITGTSPQTVAHGSSGTEVTAVPNTGYHFISWSDGVLTAARTDSNVTTDINVTATFAITSYTLTYTAGANGTITGTSPQTVAHGSSGTEVTAVPNTGYHFVSWSDGILTAARTDSNVTADINVTATFSVTTFTLTYTAGENGTISGISPQTVAHGASGTLVTAVPNTGYHFVSWSDGVLTAARTDTNVLANLSVTATFAIDMFTISGTVTAGGTGLAGVTMAGLPGSPVTDASGAYSAQVTYGSTVTVTPTHSYYTFDPASNTYTDVTADAADQNYDASLIATSQRQALIALYNSTNGDSWTIKSGWKTEPLYPDGFSMPGTEGTWYGITMDGGTQQVTSISLPGNNLAGTIPAQLGNLVNLTTLELGSNQLSGSIPVELGNMTSLQYLGFSHNQLTGSIPGGLGNLTNLTNLNLRYNQLSGPIPAELGNLTNLRLLYLTSNQLTGSIPPELGNLTNLTTLLLDENQLTGSIPVELGSLTSLTTLRLNVNQLSGPIPVELGNLVDLIALELGDNDLNGSIPAALGNLTNLISLGLGNNRLEGTIPAGLGSLTTLDTLVLKGNLLSGPIPVSLTGLTYLSRPYTDFGYNALYASDAALITFLDSRDPDWAQTQTIAPTSVTATSLDNAVIMVSWLPVIYTADAGLSNVYMSTTAGGPYTLAGSTADKATASLNVTGLTPAQRYYFVVRTQTNAHANNTNIVESGDSNEASAVAWTQISVQITGTVTLSGGAPLAGVVMNGLTGSPVTNALGVYAGTEAAGWSGTVTPTLAGHTFAPASISYTDVTANQTAQDYTATILTYTISGTVTVGGTGLAGVTMAGLPGSPVTDASGNYSAPVEYGWGGTVTPTFAGYSFAPSSRGYSNVAENHLADTYEATLLTYTISGTVTLDSAPLAGVVMSGLTGNPVTDASGIYTALVSHGWSGTVTPTLEGYTFDPVSRTYTTVTADQTAQGYTATAIIPTLTVTSPNGGETWAVGSAHAITWTQTNLTGTVTIDLYKGGVYQKTLGTAEATAGTYPWLIGTGETTGTDYIVRVWQSGAASDDSDANFAIVPAVKVDFNRDGQEDILWRYYGSGDYQGLNVAWLMNQTEALSPAPLATSQTEAVATSLLKGSTSSTADKSTVVMGTRQAELTTPRNSFRTFLEGGKVPGRRGRIMKDPVDVDGALSTRDGERIVYKDLLSVPTRKDAADTNTLASGTAELASFQLNAELVLSAVADTAWEIAGTGDFNGDGHTDILWRYYGSGTYQGLNDIWFMNGTNFVSESVFSQVLDTNWKIVGTGDFNRDGHTDILWRYYGTGDYQGLNVIWYLNGTAFVSESVFSQVTDTSWKIVGTGDFDRDGDLDILWRYYGAGDYQGLNVLWYMNGAAFVSESVFSQVSDISWEIAGTGDFNKDGYVDILWRYYGTGAYQGLNDIWYLNGTTFVSEEVFSVIPDTNWRIVNR